MSEKEIWEYDWPKDSLEHVRSCPVCEGSESTLLLEDIVDNAFRVAPGKWNLYQCRHCKSAYLNPRPDIKSIHKAYGVYYTHEATSESRSLDKRRSIIRKLYRLLLNGYYNYHHGTRRQPSIRLGAWLLLLLPGVRRRANAAFRYLPKPKQGRKLLDVGCGNGDYLLLASEAGWSVKGVEPDPKALEVARSRNLEVMQGSIEEVVRAGELFDVITMSHVIEHVHDPVNFVRLAYQCLKPGGVLYIETPNIEGLGARKFGKNWRGIESPRHLVLFSEFGLRKVLHGVGFKRITFFSRKDVRKNIALKSYRMKKGLSPYDESLRKMPLKYALRFYVPIRHNREEFLTLVAGKD